MKRSVLIFVALYITGNVCIAQNQAANWFFGYGAALQFDLNNNTVNAVNGGALSTNEGCASISDVFGNLLFYTDGSTVWDRNNNVMLNGVGLYGDSSSTQSAIIVQKPNDNNLFYVFTVDNALDGINRGLNYSIIDMSLNGGLGSVTIKNINLLPNCSEKISAVLKDCLTKSIWVITYASANGTDTIYNSFHAFEVSDVGVSNVAVVSTFPNMATSEARGYLKLSPDGQKLACANMGSGMSLFDFDVDTGIVSNRRLLTINTSSNYAYGVEFSPNSQLLYVNSSNDSQSNNPTSHRSTLSQFNLNATDISASRVNIDERQLYRGGLQLGPDGKIYRALSATYDTGLPYLGVINNPNELGYACGYVHEGVNLSPNQSSQGLPPFMQSIFNTQIDIIQNNVNTLNLPLCDGDTYTLRADDIVGATYIWTHDGVQLTETGHTLDINQSGHYQVYINTNTGDCDIEGQAFVFYHENPVATPPTGVVQCSDGNAASFDLTLLDSEILGAQDPLVFEVHYFQSQQDAIDGVNELPGIYENISNPQQIFAKVNNRSNSNCYDITSFQIEAYIAPVIYNLADQSLCDAIFSGNVTDGIATVDLSEFADIFMGNQSTADYTLTFHNNQADANSGDNPLPNNYTNTVPNETIFVRIESNLKSDCYVADSFVLTIESLPIANDVVLLQCDEDGIPEGYTIFNIDQVLDDITGGAANREVTYYLSVSDALNAVNAIDGSHFQNYFNPHIIIAKVVDTVSGCFNLAEITLQATTTDSNDTVLKQCDDDGVEDGFYSFDLTQANDAVLANLPNGLDIRYYETYEDALLETNAIGPIYTNTEPYSQTVFARVENANACYGISRIELKINELPNVITEEEYFYCQNTYPGTLTITGGVLNDSASNYYYLWSTGENTSEIEVNEPGTYTVRVTNTKGCFKDRTVRVTSSDIAVIENIEVSDGSHNNTVVVMVSGQGEYEYSIDNGFGPYQDDNIFYGVLPGIRTVYVRDKNGCGIAEKLISVIGFPKFFTPNGDNVHDYWQVYGITARHQALSAIYIFDRQGKLVAQIDPLSKGWDGTYNGRKLPANDYWFHVTLEDGRIFKGHFALKR